jgi:Protein of unknwon function (DUF3310)
MTDGDEDKGYLVDQTPMMDALQTHALNNPNNRQVGGAHYGLGEYQHWDLVWDNQMGYFEGQVTKYVTRWRKKGGVQDLEKAKHYCDKLISIYRREAPSFHRVPHDPINLEQFLAANQLAGRLEALIFKLAISYRQLDDLLIMNGYLTVLIAQVRKGAS